LGKCLENNDWSAIRSDLKKRPIECVNENSDESEILSILAKYGIKIAPSNSKRSEDPASAGLQPVTITLWGSGSPFREFLHVDDMVEACIYLMNNVDFSDLISQSPVAGRLSPAAEIKNTQINIGTGKDQTIAELAEIIKVIIGFKGKLGWDSTKPDGTQRKLLDVSKLKSLGWTDKISLKTGLTMVFDHYRALN
jgi:GDP-L-fucose synthase